MELTKKSLLRHCREMDMYSSPELNERLYLHQKGISSIRNLEEYVGVRVLWLQQNCISKIEGLGQLTQLRHLYLNENMIASIGGQRAFEGLDHLDTLNLEKNAISRIEPDDLCHLKALSTLHLAQNQLSKMEDLKALLKCPSLCCLDLRNNGLTVTERFIDDVLSKMANLRVLYLMATNKLSPANSIADGLRNYRKSVIAKCLSLRHLDDRPVFEEERRCCTAWHEGGVEAERAQRLQIQKERRAKQEANHAVFARLLQTRDARPQSSRLLPATPTDVRRDHGHGDDDAERH